MGFLVVKFLFLFVLFGVALSEVTVVSSNQILYDKSPKLPISGTGFDTDEWNTFLDLAANGRALVKDRDYMLTKDYNSGGLVLKLLSNRK